MNEFTIFKLKSQHWKASLALTYDTKIDIFPTKTLINIERVNIFKSNDLSMGLGSHWSSNAMID